ncbi:Uncharacterised protein [Mycobacteroides abscessus subsp. massiliense]|nr:Uncharacterised protein [Mycobacteroides abscessus subsp. massiliense]
MGENFGNAADFVGMRTTTSPQAFNAVTASKSKVRPTEPSVEFSTGATK